MAQTVKNLQCERPGLILWLERSPGGGHGDPLQYSCLENPHGQKSLVCYSPWGPKESDTTEQLNHHLTGNVLTSSFYLKDHNFAGYIILSWVFFFSSISILNILPHWLLSPKFLMRKLLIILVYDESLFFFCFQDFLFLCFNILSLYSISM